MVVPPIEEALHFDQDVSPLEAELHLTRMYRRLRQNSTELDVSPIEADLLGALAPSKPHPSTEMRAAGGPFSKTKVSPNGAVVVRQHHRLNLLHRDIEIVR